MDQGFRDSEIARYSHETDRRSGGAVQPAQRDMGDAHRLLRAAPLARDQRLSDLAHTWLNHFPPDQRPLALCKDYPRVANRIALCWPDAFLSLRLIKGLLTDSRGRRQGFPTPVHGELLGLLSMAEATVQQAGGTGRRR